MKQVRNNRRRDSEARVHLNRIPYLNAVLLLIFASVGAELKSEGKEKGVRATS